MKVSLIGHHDAPPHIRETLKEILTELIIHENASLFYVGNQGAFDKMAYHVLAELEAEYPTIRFFVIFAYMPTRSEYPSNHTILPEEAAKSHPKYAILKRNKWMIEHSDVVVSYVTYSFGGAAKYKETARKKGKRIVEISERFKGK